MINRIHVLEVSKSTGGVGAYVRWIVEGLDKSRFRITVACLSEGGPELAADLSRIPGVKAFSLAMNRYKIDPPSDSRVCVQLARLIRHERFDLIHAHASKPGFLARMAAAGAGVPVIYSPHNFAFHEGAGRIQAALFAAVERFAARYFTARIITVSKHERDLALRYGVGQTNQLVTISTGVNLQDFDGPIDHAAQRASLGIPADAPLIGTVARLYPPKTPLDLVQAAAQVHTDRPDAHFVWVGSGPLEAQTRAAITRWGLTQVVHLAGHRSDVPKILRTLDCFVLPSRWEALPISILEAMAAGVPVVATRNMGASELIDEGVDGLLVPPGDPVALAQAILDLLKDQARAQRLGACGRQHIEREFTREQMMTRIAQIYQEVVKGRRGNLTLPRLTPSLDDAHLTDDRR